MRPALCSPIPVGPTETDYVCTERSRIDSIFWADWITATHRQARRKLVEWQQSLASPRTGPYNQYNADQKIREILRAQHLKRVLRVAYDPDQTSSKRLQWERDDAGVARLQDEVHELRLLMTNRHEGSTKEIIKAYHGQADVEHVFRDWKDDQHFALRPQFHGTDSKVRVHVFVSLLACLLAKGVAWNARKAGRRGSPQSPLDALASMRSAVVALSTGDRGRPRTEYVLEDQPAEALRLYRGLVPNQAPFVYTPEGGPRRSQYSCWGVVTHRPSVGNPRQGPIATVTREKALYSAGCTPLVPVQVAEASNPLPGSAGFEGVI